MSFVLPKQLTTGATDAATIERYRDSLAEAERSFSRDAQTMGIGPAFKHYGHPDAINLGGPDVSVFLLRNDQIAGAVGGNAPPNTSPVNWGSEKAIVAASGDFGVNHRLHRAEQTWPRWQDFARPAVLYDLEARFS